VLALQKLVFGGGMIYHYSALYTAFIGPETLENRTFIKG